jgi:hypothetical protein
LASSERSGLWERLWFAPGAPATLTFVRWIVFGSVAVHVWVRRGSFRAIPRRAETVWEPVSLLGAVRVPQPEPGVVEVLLVIAGVGAILTLLRMWPRVTVAAAAGAYFVLLLMANSLGKINHDAQPLVLMALVLAAAPVPHVSAPRHWRWHWPVQLCRAVLGVVLAAAAVSKLGGSGLDWILSESMRNTLVMETLVLRDPALGGLGLWIAAEPWRWQLAAAGALLGEASLIGAVVTRARWLRALCLIAGAATVAGITLLMDLVGFPIVALLTVFACPGRAADLLVAGRSPLLALAPPLLGMAALAGVLFLDAGGPTLQAVPLAAGAAVFALTALRRHDAIPAVELADDGVERLQPAGKAAG